jgi:hypothetical protein
METTAQKDRPVDSKTLGKIHGAKWAKRMDNGGTLYSYTFHRSYKDGEGNYQKSTSFYSADLPAVRAIMDYFIASALDTEPAKTSSVSTDDDITPF